MNGYMLVIFTIGLLVAAAAAPPPPPPTICCECELTTRFGLVIVVDNLLFTVYASCLEVELAVAVAAVADEDEDDVTEAEAEAEAYREAELLAVNNWTRGDCRYCGCNCESGCGCGV